MGIEVRELDISQASECIRVLRESFGGIAEELSLSDKVYPLFPAFITAERLIFETGNGVKLLGLFDGGEMIGHCGLDIREREVILTRLCVIPERRGCGLGKVLVERAKEQTAELGAGRVTAWVREGSGRLAEWFIGQGFVGGEVRHLPDLPYPTVRFTAEV